MQHTANRLVAWALCIAFLLLIPLVLTIRDGNVEGVGWNWSPGDFVFAFVVLFGAGVVYELVAKKMSNTAYRAAVGLAVVTSVLLVWVTGAVGIIGNENNDANMLYGGVLVVGMLGAIVARLKPQGMSWVLVAMALAQAAVPVVALFIPPEVSPWDWAPSMVQVFAINTFFVAMYATSALLFRNAANKP